MKKVVFGLLACTTLLTVSCETNDVASVDQLYEQGVERKNVIIRRNKQSVERKNVIIRRNKQSVERKNVIIRRNNR